MAPIPANPTTAAEARRAVEFIRRTFSGLVEVEFGDYRAVMSPEVLAVLQAYASEPTP